MPRRFLRSLDVAEVKSAPNGRQTVDLRGTTSLASDLERKDILLGGYYGGGALSAQGIAGSAGRPWTVERSVKEGYGRVVWVYKAVEAIAGTQSRLPVAAYVGDPDDLNEIPDHPAVLLLNGQNCSQMGETGKIYRKRLSQQVLLSPRGAFTEVVLSRAGTPLSYSLLPPNRTRIVPAKNGMIDRYEVDPFRLGDGIRTLDPDQVRWTREPHPLDPYAGFTPLEAAGLSVEMDHFARLFNRSFLANDGRPGMVIGIKASDEDSGELDPREAERMERRFGGGLLDAGRTVVVDGTVSAVDMGGTPRDGSWLNVRDAGRDEILVAYGVPESQLGHAANAKFLNGQVEAEAYWQITQLPHNDTIDDTWALDARGPDVSIGFDVSKVDALSRVILARRAEMRTEVQQGLRTIISYQRHAEFAEDEILDVPGTRSLWVPGGVPISETAADQVDVSKLTPIGASPQAAAMRGGAAGSPSGGSGGYGGMEGTGANVGYETNPQNMTPGAKELAAGRETKTDPATGGDRGSDEDDEPATAQAQLVAEGTLEALLNAVTQRLTEVAVAKVQGPRARQGTRHWKPAAGEALSTKALDAGALVDPQQWYSQVEQAAMQVLGPVGAQTGDQVRDQLGDQAPPVEQTQTGSSPTPQIPQQQGLNHPVLDTAILAAVAWLAAAGRNKGEDLQKVIGDAEAADQKRVAAGGVATGVGPVVDAIRDWANGPTQGIGEPPDGKQHGLSAWSQSRAHAAVTAAVEGVRHGILEKLGDRVQRTWVSKHDDRVRSAHLAADGQMVTGAAPFVVGGEELRYPGDPKASPGNTVNCRCRTKYRVIAKPPETKTSPEVAAAEFLAGLDVKADSDFDPAKHPRGGHGRFTHGLADIMKAASGRDSRHVVRDVLEPNRAVTVDPDTQKITITADRAPELTSVKPGLAFKGRVAATRAALPPTGQIVSVDPDDAGPSTDSLTHLSLITSAGRSIDKEVQRRALERTSIASLDEDELTTKIEAKRAEFTAVGDAFMEAELAKLGVTDRDGLDQAQLDDLTARLKELRTPIRDEVDRLREERTAAKATRAAILRESTVEVLSELRPMGGSVDVDAVNQIHKAASTVKVGDKIDVGDGPLTVTSVHEMRTADDKPVYRFVVMHPDGTETATGIYLPNDQIPKFREVTQRVAPHELNVGDKVQQPDGVYEVAEVIPMFGPGNEVMLRLRGPNGRLRTAKHSYPTERYDRIGGDVNGAGLTSDEQARADSVAWGSRFYPSDWIDSSNRRGQITLVAPQNGVYVNRGYYEDDSTSGGGRLALSEKPGVPLPGGNDMSDPVVVHELAHRMEHVLPDVRALEWAFQWSRTTDAETSTVEGKQVRTRDGAGHQLQHLGDGYVEDEQARSDKYPQMYSGKEYRNTKNVRGQIDSPWEILSTTMESMFGGASYADQDMRAFALGVLATIGRPAGSTAMSDSAVSSSV